MGGYGGVGLGQLASQIQADPQTRNRLIRTMMGSDPSAQMDEAPEHRIADDLPGYQGTPGSTDDLESRARQGVAQRQSLADQVRQPAQPSRLDQLQTQYNALQPPTQKPESLGHKILMGALVAAGGGAGAARGLQQQQQAQEFEEGRYDRQRQSLAQQIEAEQRLQEENDLQMRRETLAQQAQSERERAQQASQERMFGQQNQLEGKRETLRQQLDRQQREESEKRQSAQFGEQEKLQGMRDAAADRRAQRADEKANTSKREKAITYWQPSLDSAERVNVMSKNYEDAVNNHDQQAMLSLLANHLGMTMGLQKGARLNQAVIEEAQKSQPWLQGMRAKFDSNGYLSGVALSPQQMKQMLDLGFERYREDVKKSRSMSGYIGVQDEPPRQISREAAQYYYEAAGRDANRARAMAKQDGWDF